MPDFNPTDLDAIVNAVVQRLRGEPDLERPPAVVPKPEPLPDLFPRRGLGIAGMELTQSTQHHGAAGPSYGADNSVPLVALKTLVVRVYPYLRQGFAVSGTATTERVTGELVMSIGQQVIYRTGPTRAEGVRTGRQADLDRTLWDRELSLAVPGSSSIPAVGLRHLNPSLNFIVPAWYCRKGRVHVAVRIWPIDQGPGSSIAATASQYAQFLNIRAPRVWLMRVNWVDGAGTVNRPSDADMLATLTTAERMLPFPYLEATILTGELTRSGNFSMGVPNGDCNQQWKDLLLSLGWTRMWLGLFGLGDLLFGMLPRAGILPGLPNNLGCRIGSAGIFVGENVGFAHELGHYYDRAHVAVAGDATNDPNYPKYGGRLRSIGEVGIDTGTSPPTVFDPDLTIDLMAYNGTFWISPYTYQGILDARDLHVSVAADPRRVRPFLLLDLRMHRTIEGLTKVQVRKAARVDAPGDIPARPAAATSPVSIDFLTGNDEIVATHHCFYVRAQAGGCGCQSGEPRVAIDREPYIDLQEIIEWPGDSVTSIAFHCGRTPFAVVRVGDPPRVEISTPDRDGDRLRVRVRADHPRETPTVAVLFSGDDGVTWQPVAFDPPDGVVSLEADRLPGGERCRFRAIATAELRASIADTDPFDLPRAKRRLHLLLPARGCPVPAGRVALRAMLDTRGLGGIAPDDVRWQSSLQGELGLGFDLIAELEAGEHAITVTAPDGVGGTLEERGIIIVGG